MSKNPEKKYQCRKEDCGLSYTLPQNRLRHEKLSGHMAQKRRDRNKTLCIAEIKMFKCAFPNCSVSSKRKSIKKRIKKRKSIKKQSRNENSPK